MSERRRTLLADDVFVRSLPLSLSHVQNEFLRRRLLSPPAESAKIR